MCEEADLRLCTVRKRGALRRRPSRHGAGASRPEARRVAGRRERRSRLLGHLAQAFSFGKLPSACVPFIHVLRSRVLRTFTYYGQCAAQCAVTIRTRIYQREKKSERGPLRREGRREKKRASEVIESAPPRVCRGPQPRPGGGGGAGRGAAPRAAPGFRCTASASTCLRSRRSCRVGPPFDAASKGHALSS